MAQPARSSCGKRHLAAGNAATAARTQDAGLCATGLRAVENGRFYRMEYTYSSVSLLLRSGVGRVSAVGLDRRQLALAAALSARSARAAWAKQRGIDGGAVARRLPTIAAMHLIECTMPLACRGAASESCAVRRRTTELAYRARSDTVPGRTVACATPLRLDVHSLCGCVFCGPCIKVSVRWIPRGQCLNRHFATFRSQRTRSERLMLKHAYMPEKSQNDRPKAHVNPLRRSAEFQKIEP